MEKTDGGTALKAVPPSAFVWRICEAVLYAIRSVSLLSDDEADKDRRDAGDRERRERLVKEHHGEKHRDQRLRVEEERGLRDAERLHGAAVVRDGEA